MSGPTTWRARVSKVAAAVAWGTLLGVTLLLAPDLPGLIPFEVIYTIQHPLLELAALTGLLVLILTGRAGVVLGGIKSVARRAAGYVRSRPPVAKLSGLAGAVPWGRID